ncbi:MAG TPA: hypothetical protein VF173_00695 [Thermoanaerobaculia bacterium]|nr:hypothetical protein [Thermoanaerobaculia bacterium]
MLNELLIAERGAREAGIEMTERHPDLKDTRRVPTLIVRLAADGEVVSIQPLSAEAKPWALRDGQHNSFPFVQKAPLALAALLGDDELRGKMLDKKAENSARRVALLDLIANRQVEPVSRSEWPGGGLVKRLQERRRQLRSLEGTSGAVVLETIDRFLRAVDPFQGGNPHRLLQGVADRLVSELRHSAQDDWLSVAIALFVGELQKANNTWESSGALLFDAAGAELSIIDQRVVRALSEALRHAEGADAEPQVVATCGLTGLQSRLLSGSFPQPNLPVLGQTFLFARNSDIRAQGRYGRFAAETMPAGEDTVIRLAAALEALTSDDRLGVTWRPIPGEAPKQSDLLLAFVEKAPEVAAAGLLAQEEEQEDFSEEVPDGPEAAEAESIAVFEKRTQRVIEAVRAKVGADFRQTPVQLAVFRKVDPANRKVVYAGTASVGDLYQAAVSWVNGERNVPAWFTLPIFRKGERKPSPMGPPHLAPLGVIRFSKQLFLRAGQMRQEVVGLPAGEAFALFLDTRAEKTHSARRRVERVLRLVLGRRAELVTSAAHSVWRGTATTGKLDLREALRTVTMLGLLLHKLGCSKEIYMNDTAFKLGQLLAAADVVHAGYCADIRGGSLPPSLLGNQVFSMAQSAPEKALATLCRRWKPYEGWAQKIARDPGRAEGMVASKDKAEQQRGWDIKRAVRCARDMKPLAEELAASLAEVKPTDRFRAELLLGYIAGLPKSQKHEPTSVDQIEDTI